MSRSVPVSVPRNGGHSRPCVRRSVPWGVSGRSVQTVSRECSGHLFDTLQTLSVHFLDTPEPGGRRAPETPRGTLRRASPPVSGDTFRDTPWTLRARRARETPVAGRGVRSSDLNEYLLNYFRGSRRSCWQEP